MKDVNMALIGARSWLVAMVRRGLLVLAAANLVFMPVNAAHADVTSAMNGYFNDMGASANVTGPTAYQGQSAGYYTLGNVWTRFPQKNVNLASVNFPSARGGCGGIDIFSGSFSFVNSAQIIALLKSVANNAVGFAFQLAIDTLCPECGQVMKDMRAASQVMNNQAINSCQMAAGLVGSVWPHSDTADREICQQFGNSTGVFSDMAQSMAGCGNGGSRTSTLNQAKGDPDWKDVNTGVARNYTWTILNKSAFFAPNGNIDEQLAEYVMTLIGTIIYVPPTDGGPGQFNPIGGDASSSVVTALLDGTDVSGPVKIWTCDETTNCLNPTMQPMSLASATAIRGRVRTLLADMVTKILSDTAITPAEQSLLQVASLPLYKILTVECAYYHGVGGTELDTLAESVSVDLVFAILEQMQSEVGKAKGAFVAADQGRIEQWKKQFEDSREALISRRDQIAPKLSTAIQFTQRTQWIESQLTASMTPQMAASLDWSRAVTIHGI